MASHPSWHQLVESLAARPDAVDPLVRRADSQLRALWNDLERRVGDLAATCITFVTADERENIVRSVCRKIVAPADGEGAIPDIKRVKKMLQAMALEVHRIKSLRQLMKGPLVLRDADAGDGPIDAARAHRIKKRYAGLSRKDRALVDLVLQGVTLADIKKDQGLHFSQATVHLLGLFRRLEK